MIPQRDFSEFSIGEWYRLDNIAAKYDQQLKIAWTKTVAQGQQVNSLYVRNVFTDTVIETCLTTAQVYGMVFNPNSPIYRTLIDRMTDAYMKVVDDDKAKERVKEILPSGLSLSERRNRSDVYGLDARAAVRIERMRQEGKPAEDIRRARYEATVQRGNLIALTEINRVINHSLETLWIDNLRVSKAEEPSDVWHFDRSVPTSVSSISQLPKRARKEWITRRDNRVCDYCLPLEGATARLGFEFDTEYGMFQAPPIHPRCRCYMIVSV